MGLRRKWSAWKNHCTRFGPDFTRVGPGFTRVGPGFFFKKLFAYKVSNKNEKIYNLLEYSCDRDVLRYLEKRYLKNYLPVIEQYDYQESSEQIGPTSNIWILWWQGYENAPDIVKACIASIRKNAGGHPVVLLDQRNYTQYITLPDHVIDNYEKGNMRVQHLADFIRTSLLYEHGGIWMDATMYMLHPFDEIVENCAFYTIHGWWHPDAQINALFTPWSDFFLACGKGNHLIGWVNKLLSEYWKQEETHWDYLLLNMVIYVIYRNVESARRMIDDVPASNINVLGLHYSLNENKDRLKQLQGDGTYLYKLTHHEDFLDSVNGEETVYHVLIHEGWDGSIQSDGV